MHASDWLEFEETIEKAGINPYVDVPKSVSVALGRRGNIPVEGAIDGTAFRSTLVPLGRGRHRLYVNGAMRKAANVDVGDRVAIAVRYDPQPRELPVPPALSTALRAQPEALAGWQAWTPSRRNEVLAYLNALKRPETVERNVEKVLRQLKRRT